MKGQLGGATLLEVLIALGLCSIIFGMLHPIISQLNKSKLRTEARKLRDTIQSLALLSRAEGSKKSITLENRFYYSEEDAILPLERYFLPASVSISATPLPQTLIFYPSGAATPATILLTERLASCSLVISLRGRCTLRCS